MIVRPRRAVGSRAVGAQAVAITEPEELEAVLAGPPTPVGLVVAGPLPAWVPEAIARIRAAHCPLTVEVADPGDAGDARAGREIGLLTALLVAGVAPGEIVGVDPRRVARVAEVVRRWEAGGAGS